ncbi:MAG: aminopeptidase P N-terminal domain-containing protein [Planctomycetota bacterium]|nr:aminopeptidase P N-terminal domain-containing protein [Planctomycetota bacterium]
MISFADHRARFLQVLQRERAAAVVATATHKIRNHDTEYRFRPDSDFWWLTGFAEPDSVLVLLPALKPDAKPRSVLFLREKDRERETWTGRRLGVEAAPAKLQIDEARGIEKLWTDLPNLLRGYERVVYRTGVDEPRDREMLALLAKLRATAKAAAPPPQAILDPAAFLHELRLFKDAGELDVMRRGAKITREAHVAAMRAAKPNVNEREIDALLDSTFRRLGGTGAAYTNIVAGGANACILHYVENDQPLRDGDLLLVDAGCEVDWYACDVTRTFPVSGTFTPDQRAVYQIVLDAQLAAIAMVKPGAAFDAPHQAALAVLSAGLVRLGLLTGTAEQVLAQETFKRFYMHRTSHWLGLDVHDCGAYLADGKPRTLEPGMVLTIEPGLYLAEDDTTIDARWRGIGVRIEDDVLVTQDGHEVLTRGIPKSVDEVEAACRASALAGVRA